MTLQTTDDTPKKPRKPSKPYKLRCDARPTDDPKVLKRRAQRRAEYARYRARRRAGVLALWTEIDTNGITALIHGNWLTEKDATDMLKIGAAVARMLKASG